MDRFLPLGKTGAATEEIQISAYVSVVILTLFLWDWLLCIPGEVKVVHRTQLNAPIVAYYLSRLSSLGYCICSSLANISIIPPNAQLETSRMAFWWAAGSTTSLLFFFRICAVYNHSRAVRTIFSALWLLVAITPATIFFKSRLNCFPSTQEYCDTWSPLSIPSNAAVFVNDTLVFLGVWRQIYKNAVINEPVTRTKRFKLLIMGEGLYKVSKSLLQSGQLYYGITIGFQITSAITVFFGLPYAQPIVMSYVALSSAMVCKVHRMVLLCDTSMDPLSTKEIQGRLRVISADGRMA